MGISTSSETTATSATLPSTQGPPTVSSSFEGITQDNGFWPNAWYPPDVTVAASSSHVMESINRIAAIWDKQGTLVNKFSLWDFFDTTACNMGDNRLIFDTDSKRWFFIVFESFDCIPDYSPPYQLSLAISVTEDPNGDWNKYVIPFSSLPDQPKLATSNDKLAIGVNMHFPQHYLNFEILK